jgi:NAD(P)H-hydrate repair Nnr-like enzyme with NAD(P)H-hydrate epimerase domain
MLIEVIGRGFSNRFFRRLFMLIDFSLFCRCGPGRNDADGLLLAHHMHNKQQS